MCLCVRDCVQLTFMGFHLHFRNHTHGWAAKIHVLRHDLRKALLLDATRRLAGAVVGDLADKACLYAVSKLALWLAFIAIAVVVLSCCCSCLLAYIDCICCCSSMFVVFYIFIITTAAAVIAFAADFIVRYCSRSCCLLLLSLAGICKCSYLFLRLSRNINKELTLIPMEFTQTFDSCAEPKAKSAEAAIVKPEDASKKLALHMQYNNNTSNKALGGLGRVQIYCNLDATAALEIAKLLLVMFRCLRDVLRWIWLKHTAATYNVAYGAACTYLYPSTIQIFRYAHSCIIFVDYFHRVTLWHLYGFGILFNPHMFCHSYLNEYLRFSIVACGMQSSSSSSQRAYG